MAAGPLEGPEKEGCHNDMSPQEQAKGIKQRPQLSQNFLTDGGFLDKEVAYAELKADDVVLEVGGGTGELSRRLASVCRVHVVEKDGRLAKMCREKLGGEKTGGLGNADVIEGDALEVQFPEFNKIVSNIPYHISGPLTFKFLEHDFELGVIIYQKEFADKMAAPAGSRNYGRLSVSVQARAEVELLDVVPKECFAPIPKVDSRIVRLRPKGKGVQLPALFDGAVRALFQHRQKSVKNALKDSFHEIAKDVPKDVPAEEVKRIAGEFDSERKVYQLSVSEVIEVAKMIEELI